MTRNIFLFFKQNPKNAKDKQKGVILMRLRNTHKTLLLSLAISISGCKTINLDAKSSSQTLQMNQYTAIYKVNAKVSDEEIRNAVAESLSKPRSEYYRRYHSEYSSNNQYNKGVIKSYDVKGWTITKHQTGTDLIYEDGLRTVDNRKLHNSNRFTGQSKEVYIRTDIVTTGKLKTVTVSNSKRLTDVNNEPTFNILKRETYAISLASFDAGVEKRIKNIHLSFPTRKEYTETVTLKNDDVTAFANIQRNFYDSFLSTNNKTDSKKSGSFTIANKQKVRFQLYPYKNVSKLRYSFYYDYAYNEKGGSNFNSQYPKDIKKMIISEFNK